MCATCDMCFVDSLCLVACVFALFVSAGSCLFVSVCPFAYVSVLVFLCLVGFPVVVALLAFFVWSGCVVGGGLWCRTVRCGVVCCGLVMRLWCVVLCLRLC